MTDEANEADVSRFHVTAVDATIKAGHVEQANQGGENQAEEATKRDDQAIEEEIEVIQEQVSLLVA